MNIVVWGPIEDLNGGTRGHRPRRGGGGGGRGTFPCAPIHVVTPCTVCYTVYTVCCNDLGLFERALFSCYELLLSRILHERGPFSCHHLMFPMDDRGVFLYTEINLYNSFSLICRMHVPRKFWKFTVHELVEESPEFWKLFSFSFCLWNASRPADQTISQNDWELWGIPTCLHETYIVYKLMMVSCATNNYSANEFVSSGDVNSMLEWIR